jgi:acyl dehydratase
MATTELPPAVKSLIGVESDLVEGPDEVCKPMIRHWCEMVEDANPLYTDDEYAKDSEFGEVISPPVMARTWTMPPWWSPQPYQEDQSNPLVRVIQVLESTSQIQLEIEEEYFLPIRLGDRLSCTTTVTNVTPLKRTRLGVGHFVTYLLRYRNQRGEVVSTLRATLLLLCREQ